MKQYESMLYGHYAGNNKSYPDFVLKGERMRTKDIVIGETYRHRDHPNYAYAKAVKIIRPMPEYKQKTAFGLTEEEKNVKCVCVKCEWLLSKNDSFGLIKYFNPCDLIKDV